MDIPVFFAPPEEWSGDEIQLPPAEASHAVKVMRLKKGDRIMVIDGLGEAGR